MKIANKCKSIARFVTETLILLSLTTILSWLSNAAFASHAKTANEYQKIDRVVAKVNNSIITAFEIEERYKMSKILSGSGFKNTNSKIFFDQILERAIDEKLINFTADKIKLTVDDKELERYLSALAKEKGRSLPSFIKFLNSKNISFEKYKEQVKSEILWGKIISQEIRPKISVAEFELKEYFDKNKMSEIVEKFAIKDIFIERSNDAKKLTEKLLLELEEGANFTQICRQFSSYGGLEQCSEKDEKEMINSWFTKSDLDLKVYEAISKIRVGEYSHIVEHQDGYRIFKLIAKNKEIWVSDQNQEIAKERISRHKLQLAVREYLLKMRLNNFIELRYY